jgi:hypothetical protein
MEITWNKAIRQEQKVILKALYPDYDAPHHDAFVVRYNKEYEQKAQQRYLLNRGLGKKS